MNTLKTIFKSAITASVLLGAIAVTTPANANEIKSWQGKVVKLVAKKQTYPRAAMRNELEGKAKVKLSIDRSGSINDFEIIEPTGHDALDSSVPKLVERLNPLPAPPASLPDSNLSFVLPLTWQIQ